MKFILLSFFYLLSLNAYTQKAINNSFYKSRPKTFIPVNDFAGMLTKEERTLLNKKLLQYGDTSSNAIVIITQKTLKDTSTGEVYQLEEAAKHYFNNWGIGLKEKNNGVLFFVIKDDRKIRIATGSGIDDILTNDDCQEIIDNNIIPHFKNKNYYKGLDEATGKVMQILSPELYASADTASASSNNTPLPVANQSYSYVPDQFNQQSSVMPFFILIVIVVVIILVIVKLAANNSVSDTVYNSSGAYNPSFSRRSGLIGFFSGLFLGSSFSNRGSSGNYNNTVHNTNYNDNNSSSFDSGFSSSSSDSFSSSSDSGSSSGGSSDGGGASGSW